MTGILDRARAATDAYRADVAQAVGILNSNLHRIDQALGQLSGSGSLGNSQNAHLVAVRSHLARAKQMFLEASQHAEASREPLLRLVQRAFPP